MFPGALDSHFDGGEADTECGGDVVVGEVVHVAHDQGHTKSGGHRVEDRGDALLIGHLLEVAMGLGLRGDGRGLP